MKVMQILGSCMIHSLQCGKSSRIPIVLSQICRVINGEVSLLQIQSNKIVDIFVLKIRAGHVKKHECFCVSQVLVDFSEI